LTLHKTNLGSIGYDGLYATYGIAVDIKPGENVLLMSIPGVPEGYEPRLIPIDEHRFDIKGGPLDGATAEFKIGEDGTAVSIVCGHMVLDRLPEGVEAPEPTERLLLPEIQLTQAKREDFSALLEEILTKRDGEWIDYQLPYPKYEFTRYVSQQDMVIFHGSGNSDIEEFTPVRKSFELRDETGRGNLQAVYGTHDGIWPMFFAIVDRPRLNGSIRNGVMYFQNQDNEVLEVYNFSINQEQLAERPWREGTLYFLPREPFRRLYLTGGALSNEWASETALKPLAKLALKPEDFPFLEQIGGHDDSIIIRSRQLAQEVIQAAKTADLLPDGFLLTFDWNQELSDLLNEFIDLQKEFLPAAQFTVAKADEGRKAQLTAILPAAVRQVFINMLRQGNLLPAED